MPRGGSKKGEHRGNAKPKPEGTPQAIMKAAVVRKPGAGGRRQQVHKVEQDVRMAQIIHGVESAEGMTPKDVMVENMAYFQNAAYEYKAMARFMALQPDSDATRIATRLYEQEVERNLRMASDEARNVAPYIHSRRSAIAMLEGSGHGDDIVQMMFDEIDRRSREHPMVIEHVPQKKSA